VESLERRVFLSAAAQADMGFRIIGITGNQQFALSDRYTDETLYDIKFGTAGSDPAYLDGFTNPPPDANTPLTVLTTVDSVPGAVPTLAPGITQGSGALRVEVPQEPTASGQHAYWGLRTGNVVDLLGYGAQTYSFDVTFIGKELNGGSFSGADNSFTGFAQSNQIAINLSDGTWIQKSLDEVGTDDTGMGGQWGGVDRTHHLTWDLNWFTTSDGSSLRDYIAGHNITGAWIWMVTQGWENNPATANGTQGPLRYYFDNFELSAPKTLDNSKFSALVGDFDPVTSTKLKTLPYVPDTDAIGYNPEDGMLYRTSGSSSYRDDPNRVGYNDNQFMEKIDLNAPDYPETGVFNANYEGDGGTGPSGLPAPRPNFVLPTERRTGDTDPAVGDMVGPGEYHALRDFTWSTTDHAFIGTDERGLYKLTATGNSTKLKDSSDSDELKGITFATIDGQRRLLVAQRDTASIAVLDPTDYREVATIRPVYATTGEDVPTNLNIETETDRTL
jgi:hypothetical protein